MLYVLICVHISLTCWMLHTQFCVYIYSTYVYVCVCVCARPFFSSTTCLTWWRSLPRAPSHKRRSPLWHSRPWGTTLRGSRETFTPITTWQCGSGGFSAGIDPLRVSSSFWLVPMQKSPTTGKEGRIHWVLYSLHACSVPVYSFFPIAFSLLLLCRNWHNKEH